MGKPLTHEYGTDNTILKYFPYQAAACVVTQSTGTPKTIGGRKIVPAGTPFPTNDGSCKGILLHNYDVTMGDVAGAYVFEGSIDEDAVTANGVTVNPEAKAVLPRVTFFKKEV